MLFVVSSSRLLDRIGGAAHLQRRASVAGGAPPKSLAVAAALVLRKLCEM
jgi:hypothetical protein